MLRVAPDLTHLAVSARTREAVASRLRLRLREADECETGGLVDDGVAKTASVAAFSAAAAEEDDGNDDNDVDELDLGTAGVDVT